MKGKLLIATPDLLIDEIFSKSVILMADEHPDGKVGFILNKPLPVTVKEITSLHFPLQAYNGGPVSSDKLYFIHKLPEIIEGAVPIHKDLFWGGNLEKLMQMNLPVEDLQDKIKFFIGYSGWGKNQLEKEIREGAWLVTENNIDIFQLNPKSIWKELLIKTNPEWELWKNAPINPALN